MIIFFIFSQLLTSIQSQQIDKYIFFVQTTILFESKFHSREVWKESLMIPPEICQKNFYTDAPTRLTKQSKDQSALNMTLI